MRDIPDDGDAQIFERAPAIQNGERIEQRLRRMLVRTVAGIHYGNRQVARKKMRRPGAACRMTIASGRMAPRVLSVSTSDSPFETLDAATAIESTSAPRRLAAISKLVRVRVDDSKNKLTIVRFWRVVNRLNGCLGAG